MKPRISKWLIKAKWLIDNIVLIIIIIIVEALLLAWLKDSDRRGIVWPFCLCAHTSVAHTPGRAAASHCAASVCIV